MLQSASTTITWRATRLSVPESDCRRGSFDAPGQDTISDRFAAGGIIVGARDCLYFLEGRLACRWVAVKGCVEPFTRVEISNAAAGNGIGGRYWMSIGADARSRYRQRREDFAR
jgi:hypothetical protein